MREGGEMKIFERYRNLLDGSCFLYPDAKQSLIKKAYAYLSCQAIISLSRYDSPTTSGKMATEYATSPEKKIIKNLFPKWRVDIYQAVNTFTNTKITKYSYYSYVNVSFLPLFCGSSPSKLTRKKFSKENSV